LNGIDEEYNGINSMKWAFLGDIIGFIVIIRVSTCLNILNTSVWDHFSEERGLKSPIFFPFVAMIHPWLGASLMIDLDRSLKGQSQHGFMYTHRNS